MTMRLPLVGLVLLAGCLGDERKPLLVSPGVTPPGHVVQTPDILRVAHSAPATEALTKQVDAVGQKVIHANPQSALRPRFCAVGAPKPEIFHQVEGASFQHCCVYVSEGLVRRCKTEGQLAAVLAHEVGKIVAEREALVPASVRLMDQRRPPDVPVGNDSRGLFGSPDGTRYVEQAKLDQYRQHPNDPPPPPPSPDVLARSYLGRAGFAPADLDDVAGLLQQAEENSTVERLMKGGAGS
jgi:hypothetical protein